MAGTNGYGLGDVSDAVGTVFKKVKEVGSAAIDKTGAMVDAAKAMANKDYNKTLVPRKDEEIKKILEGTGQ